MSAKHSSMARSLCVFSVTVVLGLGGGGRAEAHPELEWQQTFGGRNDDRGRSVQQTSDGGYVLCGSTESFGAGYLDVYLLKTSPPGELEWQRTFGGSEWDVGVSVEQRSDGGYVLCGSTRSFGAGGEDVYLLKTSPSGELEWQQTFGGNERDSGRSVEQTSDGGYVVCGWTESFGAGGPDVYLVKLRGDGSPSGNFRRGDAAADGAVNITDAVFTLNHLFLGGPAPACADAADADDNGDLQITDAVYTLNRLFLGGPELPAPGATRCGSDPTDDALDCQSYNPCGA